MNEHDADLEIARIRDLLGRPDPETPIEQRILASTLNKIDAGHVADLGSRRRSRLPLLAVAASIRARIWKPPPAAN